MGIDMEIDLIAGLIKPKTALSALPALENPELTEGALPDFTALLVSAQPESFVASEGVPELEMAIQAPIAMPPLVAPEPALEQIVNGAEITAAELDSAPEKPPLPVFSATPLLPGAPLVPPAEPTKSTEPTFHAPPLVASATTKEIAPTATTAHVVFKTDLAPAPLVNPGPRVSSDMWIKREPSEVPAIPTAPKTPVEPKLAALFSPLPTEKTSVLPAKTPVEPQIETPIIPAKIAPKGAVQGPPPLAPALGLTNIETVTEDPAEVQFSIKIERQAAEIVSISRPTLQATPVASQITTQLPQLLSKAAKQTVELRLDPPELGRVTIHLTTNDTQVTAQIVADRVDTIELMRRHAELLTATLARAGFSEANLSFQQGQRQDEGGEFEQFQGVTELVESDTSSTSAPTRSGQDGRLDIRL